MNIGKAVSIWLDTTPDTNFSSLQKDTEVDVAIIGGGIVGMTAAALLKEAGKTVAVLEANRIVKNVTGYTTAKITSLHAFIYRALIKRFGENSARTYGEANQAAIEQISSIVEQKNILCDFIRQPAFSYTEQEEKIDFIKKEAEAAQKLGLPASYIQSTPLPFSIKGAVRFENQAQFHPRKYLLALANEIHGDGSYIFENTLAYNIEEKDACVVTTNKGKIKSKYVIIATHFPFWDKGFFYARLYPHHAYVLGIRIKGEVPEGLYYSEDGLHHSIRNSSVNGQKILLVGGGFHFTGRGGNTIKIYEDIEKYAKDRFEIESIDYHWSTEDYETMDGVPYIGRSPTAKRIYVASGFGGWGMTNGTLSGMIISDLILRRSNPWSAFFSPSRLSISSSKRLIVENTLVMKHYFKGLLHSPPSGNPKELAKGEGKKMRVKSMEIAAYKDEESKIYTLSPTCPHMRCKVNWNPAEKTWDCPCHGSRFNYDGKLIHGPALSNLPKIKPENKEPS